MLVGVGAVVREDELRERGGGEDVGHDEWEVHGCPDASGNPMTADGVDVDAVGIDLEIYPKDKSVSGCWAVECKLREQGRC